MTPALKPSAMVRNTRLVVFAKKAMALPMDVHRPAAAGYF
jgi:hypothetical protein